MVLCESCVISLVVSLFLLFVLLLIVLFLIVVDSVVHFVVGFAEFGDCDADWQCILPGAVFFYWFSDVVGLGFVVFMWNAQSSEIPTLTSQ